MTPLTLEDVHRVAVEVCTCEVAEVRGDTKIAELNVDSIGLVELAIELQDRFGVELGHDDLGGVETMQDLLTVINDKR